MRIVGLVTRGRVTLGRRIVVIAVIRAYERAYESLRVYGSLRPESDGLLELRSQMDYQSHEVRRTIR